MPRDPASDAEELAAEAWGSELESSFTTLKRELAVATAGGGAGWIGADSTGAGATAVTGCDIASPTLPWIPQGGPIPPEALMAADVVVIMMPELAFWCFWIVPTLAVVIRLPPAEAAATPPALPPPPLMALRGKPPLLALILIPPLTGTLAELNIFTLLTVLVWGLTMLTAVPIAEPCIPGVDPGTTTPTGGAAILAGAAWDTFS
ncbi:hypothetical protein EYF80_010358 [Liparis tanakae]|uniref:Uncharacterized protein n=1 Tax=Liparis tanakae TaxID=230148 RepID=A0A4Z2IPF7_9TELE|nr:hypothetical protein EYF80_010358 [Liparis tanakae]